MNKLIKTTEDFDSLDTHEKVAAIFFLIMLCGIFTGAFLLVETFGIWALAIVMIVVGFFGALVAYDYY